MSGLRIVLPAMSVLNAMLQRDALSFQTSP
jgi:hypothetical protein